MISESPKIARLLQSACVLGLLLIAATSTYGQIDRGTIQGVVRDQTGAVIPGAKVQIVRIDTNSALDMSTNEEGLYTAPNLPVGDYRIVVEQAGFSTFKREPIGVRTGVQIRVDVTLQTGGVTETVSVTDEAPLLDTATMNNAAGFDEQRCRLQGRADSAASGDRCGHQTGRDRFPE